MSLAGELRTRLTLQRAIEDDDGQGGIVRSYVDARKVWARITPLAAQGDVAADASVATHRLRIETRAPLPLTLRHRFVDGDKVYRIVSYLGYGGLMIIKAELQVQ